MEDVLKRQQDDLFEDNGLKVARSKVEVGKTYPIYGMITKILDEQPEKIVVELNFQIQAELKYKSLDQLTLLKERVFETGIFVAKIQETEPKVVVNCKKVIFGKRSDFNS